MSTAAPSKLPPAVQLSQMIVSVWVPQAVHAAAELGLADVLSGGSLSSRATAKRLGTHADTTERLMRALARCLESRAPASRRAWSRLMGAGLVWDAWGRLVECVRTGRKAYGGAEADTFDALAADPENAAVFHQAMADLTRSVAPAVARTIDLAGARSVVDVGGGYGELLCAILEAHPPLEGTVFDLPHARQGALALFSERGLSPRAAYVSGSFFQAPPPPGDVYVLKSVIHDWDDARSLRILARCREAMSETSRLLLVEPAAGAPSGDPTGDWFLAFSDLNMLVNTGGRERSESEYVALLEAASLRVTAVRETRTFYRVFESVRA